MTIPIDVLVSGAAISGNTQPARSTITASPDASAGTQGTGGQVISNGSITDNSCNVDSDPTGQTMDLGKWASSYFTGTGSGTTKAPSHIRVKDCPTSMAKVAVPFDGVRNQSDTTPLAANGGAISMAIKLYEDDQNTTVNLDKVSEDHPVAAGATADTGSTDLEFYADYVSTGAVAAGDANNTANFNMIYS